VLTKVSVSYWSYKAVIDPGHQQLFFNDFWFSHLPIPKVQAQISDSFIALFLAQVLTLAAGLLSLAVKRIGIRIIPFLSSITSHSLDESHVLGSCHAFSIDLLVRMLADVPLNFPIPMCLRTRPSDKEETNSTSSRGIQP